MPTSARPSLPELQRWMRWVLTHPDGVGAVIDRPAGRAPLPRHWTRGPEPRRWLKVIGESPEVDCATRLAIYGDGYFLRIVEVMAINYVCLRNAVGAHDFDHHLAREYLVKHPSTFRCIDNVGARMAEFLRRHALGRQKPFLPDLARLEWAFHESFYADEAPPLDVERLKSVPAAAWSTARVRLDGSVRLLDLSYPVVPLWRDNGNWSALRQSGLCRKRSLALIYRLPDGQVRVAEETPGAFAALQALQSGRSFGAALRAGLRRKLAPGRAKHLFREWTRLGIIRQVDFR